MFANPEIVPADMPTAEDLQWHSLADNFVRRLQAQAVSTSVAVFAGVMAVNFWPAPIGFRLSPAPILVGLLLMLAIGLAWPMISVPRKGYAIRTRDLIFRSGVLRRSVSAVPFNRVQHVETSSSPLDRYFGLATLRLYTAGGSGADLAIHGLPTDVAERLRVFVLERAGEETEDD